MTEIIVTGAAERCIPADRALLGVSRSFVESQREAAVRRAAAEHERLVERAQELVAEGTAERYAANPIDTFSSGWRDERGQQIDEHHATVSVTIELVEPTLVGALTVEFAESGADARVSWELSPERRNAVLRELRAEAVADARRAAEDYAAALGASDAAIVSIRDGQGGPGGSVPLARAAMADKAPPEVSVREVEVGVRIEAVFTV